MNSQEIKKIVGDIRAVSLFGEKTPHQIKSRYLEFYETFPKLFDAAMDKDFPMTYLNMMLVQLDQLKNGATVDAVDTVVYGQLREKYIDPFFPNTTDANVSASEPPQLV